MIKVIIFDFDGVLVDSNRIKHDAWHDVFGDLNPSEKKIALGVYYGVYGLTRRIILENVFKALGRPESQLQDFVEVRSAKYNFITQTGILESGLVAGAKELLEKYCQKYALYINSSTPTDALDETIDNLGIRKYFKEIYGRPETKESALEKIFALEGINGNAAVFVGDAEFDRKAAYAFGCFFIGIRNDFNNWTDREYFVTVGSVRDVRGILEDRPFDIAQGREAASESKNHRSGFGRNSFGAGV